MAANLKENVENQYLFCVFFSLCASIVQYGCSLSVRFTLNFLGLASHFYYIFNMNGPSFFLVKRTGIGGLLHK